MELEVGDDGRADEMDGDEGGDNEAVMLIRERYYSIQVIDRPGVMSIGFLAMKAR